MAAAFLFLFIPLLLSPHSTEAHDSVSSVKFKPTKAIIITGIISFVFLLVFYFYSRFYPGGRTAAILSSRPKGLSQTILNSFPTMLYSDIKSHKIGKSALECAVCLNDFEDEDSLRLLPSCSHVFHEDCIDAWLASHVTCPVCRDALEKEEAGENITVEVVEQGLDVAVEDEEQRIGRKTKRRGVGSLMRSHTTGHIKEDWERYTLRVPESVRNDIIVARMLKRDRSLPERGAKGGGNEGRSMLVRWPSFFVRSRVGEEQEEGERRVGE